MADPRNIAHDKKVQDEKQEHGEEILPGAAATPQPGKKPPLEPEDQKGETYQEHSHRHQDKPADE